MTEVEAVRAALLEMQKREPWRDYQMFIYAFVAEGLVACDELVIAHQTLGGKRRALVLAECRYSMIVSILRRAGLLL